MRYNPLEDSDCVTCGSHIRGGSKAWKDVLSMREYSISGMCQKCQDSVFDEDGQVLADWEVPVDNIQQLIEDACKAEELYGLDALEEYAAMMRAEQEQ